MLSLGTPFKRDILIKTTAQIIEALKDTDPSKKWKIEEYHEKRSLDANAYFYVLQNKLAEKLKMNNEKLHKILLKDYGEKYQVLISAKITNEELKKTFDYFDIIDTIVKNGKKFNVVNIYMPSHKMDTKQMARLIDGLVMECKQQDIETLPPEELERIKREWKAY